MSENIETESDLNVVGSVNPSGHDTGDQNQDQPPNLNLPNALSVVRIVGSFVLVTIAVFGFPIWFVAIYLVLGFTDLIDGPLARWLKQESNSGAKLDSIADILLSIALITGVSLLKWEWLKPELFWLILPVASYVLMVGFSFAKFRRGPALHTLSAKVNHFFVAIAGLCVLLDFSIVPLRIACVTTALANVEAILILARLRVWRTDITSLFHLRR